MCPPDPYEGVAELAIGVIVGLGVLQIPFAVLSGLGGLRTPDATRCAHCGYSRVGLREWTPCPECGRYVPADAPPTPVRVRWANLGVMGAVGVATAATGVAFRALIGPMWDALPSAERFPAAFARAYAAAPVVATGWGTASGYAVVGAAACCACAAVRTDRPVRRALLSVIIGVVVVALSVAVRWHRGDTVVPRPLDWTPLWCFAVVLAHGLTGATHPRGTA